MVQVHTACMSKAYSKIQTKCGSQPGIHIFGEYNARRFDNFWITINRRGWADSGCETKSCYLTGPKTTEFVFSPNIGGKIAKWFLPHRCSSTSLEAVDLKEGDEVITMPLTFCTVNAIIIWRHTKFGGHWQRNVKYWPWVHSTIDHRKPKLSYRDLQACLSHERNLQYFRKVWTDSKDCAHAIETLYEGQPAGTIGHFCFSFYAIKTLLLVMNGLFKMSEAPMKICACHFTWQKTQGRGIGTPISTYDVVGPGHNLTLLHAGRYRHRATFKNCNYVAPETENLENVSTRIMRSSNIPSLRYVWS